MRLLLDTHVAIWALTADNRLSKNASARIADPENHVFVSAVSIWEIAIKHALGRGAVPFSGEAALGYFSEAGYEWLDIRPAHAAAIEALPMLHGDPFDRMLVAQALTEPLRLLTHDQALVPYSDTILLV
ncbi:MAG TPA: type II toxin-antitoxin system VapC family toxin [Luteimonas sp.]|nr:type II toxin-antitoxin system VapC family toxin [Luteimonas sp.]